MTTVTISLPESLKDFVDSQLAAEGYGNVSEYFRHLVRTAREKKEKEEAHLEKLLLEGLNSGDPVEVTPEFWKDLDADYARYKKQWESKNKSKKRKS